PPRVGRRVSPVQTRLRRKHRRALWAALTSSPVAASGAAQATPSTNTRASDVSEGGVPADMSDAALVLFAAASLADLRAERVRDADTARAREAALVAELDAFRAAAAVLLDFAPHASPGGTGLRPSELAQYARDLRAAVPAASE